MNHTDYCTNVHGPAQLRGVSDCDICTAWREGAKAARQNIANDLADERAQDEKSYRSLDSDLLAQIIFQTWSMAIAVAEGRHADAAAIRGEEGFAGQRGEERGFAGRGAEERGFAELMDGVKFRIRKAGAE